MFKIKIPNRNHSSDWRLIFGNINTLGDYSNTYNATKWDQMKYICDESQPDVLGLSEHNRVVSRMARQNKPQEVMGRWQERTVCRFTWLKNIENKTTYETGGTGIITSGKGSTHTIGSGEDQYGLGRWNWITIQGKRDKITTIISIYRPGKNQTTLDRQQAHTSKNRPSVAKSKGPQELWDKELATLVKSFKNKGHEVIAAGDWNDNLNDNNSTVRRMMNELGMEEVIIARYGEGPETYSSGSTTIDGIFGTRGINIKQGGYTTHEESPSDHRWLWIDISEATLMGRNRDDHAPPLERRATAKIPSVRNKFNDILEGQVSRYQLYNKTIELFSAAEKTGKLTNEQAAIYEIIEDRMKRGVKFADSKCRKVRRGQIPFSIKAQEIMRKLRILKLIQLRDRLKRTTNRPRMSKLKRLAKKYSYQGPLFYERSEDVQSAVKNAKIEYNEFKPTANKLRENYLYQIAQEKAEEDPKGREVDWHHSKLQGEEKIKLHFKYIRKCEGKNNRRGVDKVDITDREGTTSTIHDKDEVAKHICKANIEKRQQARNTPCRKEPLLSLLGEQMEYDRWEEILKGNIKLPDRGLEEGTRLWYDVISTPMNKSFKIKWTTEEYCDSWQKMDEIKSCIPGIHTVHMKCVKPSMKAAEILSKLAMIPLITGYAPKSWMSGIDSMIPKKTVGECRPDKLRLILLFDARFNHNNKLIGKKMMEFAEENGLLAREQFGSRKHKSAIEHAINKRLTLDISRQNKSNCIYIANDAKSCYDRILLMVAYLAMRQSGVPQLAALSSIKTLVNMRIRIKTAHGISKTQYGGSDWKVWPHGIGQGNGYGPAIWALISSPLLTIMRKQGHGTSIHSPISNEKLTMAGFSFVDDTDQCEMTMRNKSWENQMLMTQKSLNLWETLIRTTGGAIEPSKSDWTKLKYRWTGGRAVMEKADQNDKLFMRSPNGDVKELTQKEPDEARETLGVWQTATGNETTQTQKLIGKIRSWGSSISKSGINSREVSTAVKITIGKTIRYPLGATTLSHKEAKKVNKEFRWAALGKMHIVRTASALITAAPVMYGGLGMNNDVFTNQMIDHTLSILEHGHRKSTTGILLRTSLECLSIEAGVGGDPGTFDINKMTWLTENTWVGSTIEAYGEVGLELETSVEGLRTWNARDEYLMERAYDLASGRDLLIFNKVRLFLRVATVSDIVTANGKEIDKNILQGKRSNSPTFSEFAYTWPNIPSPSTSEIQLWGKIISEMFAITQGNRRIYVESAFRWDYKFINYSKWTIGEQGLYIYERRFDCWKRWKKQADSRRRRHSTKYVFHDNVDEIRTEVRPISVQHEDNNTISLAYKGKVTSFEEGEGVESSTGWILPLVIASDGDEICFAQQLLKGRGTMVSDGSYKDDRSSAAFTTTPEKEIKGSLTIPGNKDEQSSYRAELGGILASIVYANKIAAKYDITDGSCMMICDNKGALASSFGYKKINPRWKCYDLLCMTRFQLKNSPLKWTHKHVKGHQDNNTTYENLDIISQANVDVDTLAKIELLRNRQVDDGKVLPGQCWKLKHTEGGEVYRAM